MRPTLALIVRNESATITDTLWSARRAMPGIAVCVHDTGSTDDTIARVQAWADDAGGHVELASRPFDDFSGARNACLDHAFQVSEGSPVVMVDAGVIVSGAWNGKAPAAVRCVLGTDEYPRVQVFTPGWHYIGAVHEYPEGPGRAKALHNDSGLVFTYSLRDTNRSKRWLRDLALLEGDMSPRGRFYYAQTLDCLGRKTQAKPAYLARAAMAEGYSQERVLSYMRCIPLADSFTEADRYAHEALVLDPSRGDAWLLLCDWYERAQAWDGLYGCATKAIMLKPRAGALFVRRDREARAHMYAGDAASSRGMYSLARDHWVRALEGDGLCAEDRDELRIAVAASIAAEGERGCDKSTEAP